MVRKPLKFKLSESVTKIKHDWVIYTRNVMTRIRFYVCKIGWKIFYVYKKEKQSKIENFNSLGMIIYWIELMSLSHPNMNEEKEKKKKILESFESEKL